MVEQIYFDGKRWIANFADGKEASATTPDALVTLCNRIIEKRFELMAARTVPRQEVANVAHH